MHQLIWINNHRFSLVDTPDGPEDKAAEGEDRVSVGPGSLTVHSGRPSGWVPLTVELTKEAPSINEDEWSSVVEASLEVSSGKVQVAGQPEAPPPLSLDSGAYRALVCLGGLDTAGKDRSDGADHYKILLWPGEAQPVRPRKTHAAFEDAVRDPKQDEVLSAVQLSADDPHRQYDGLAELARHGTESAIAKIHDWATEQDEAGRFIAVRVHTLSDPPRLSALMPFLDDPSTKVRTACLAVIDASMLDFEFGALASLDTNAAQALVNKAAQDKDPSVKALASSVADRLALLSEDLDDDDLDDDLDEELDISSASPMALTLGAAISALVKAGEIELCEGVHPVVVSMRVLDSLRKDTLRALFHGLVDDEGVEEVYCDERAFGEALRAADRR